MTDMPQVVLHFCQFVVNRGLVIVNQLQDGVNVVFHILTQGKKFLNFGNRHSSPLEAADGVQLADMTEIVNALVVFCPFHICQQPDILVVAQG